MLSLKSLSRLLALTLAILPGAAFASHEVTPLFTSHDIVHITLKAPLERLIADRSASSAPAYGTLLVEGEPSPLRMSLSLRGLTRRQAATCAFPPLRLDILDPAPNGSLFAAQKKLKIVTPCQGGSSFQQYVFLEYSAYLMYNQLTPLSYKARLASIKYLNPRGGLIASRIVYLLENEKDLARRNGLREAAVGDRISIAQLSPRDSARHAIFEYMIGNLDWSQAAGPPGAGCCHNTKLLGVKGLSANLVPIPYDFDETGLVDPPYAAPPVGSGETEVEIRRYRGYCAFNAEALSVAGEFRAHEADILAVLEDMPPLDARSRQRAHAYLERFFRDIATDGSVSTKLLSTCLGKRPA